MLKCLKQSEAASYVKDEGFTRQKGGGVLSRDFTLSCGYTLDYFFFLLGLLIFRSRGPPKQRDFVPFFLSLLICRREPTYK